MNAKGQDSAVWTRRAARLAGPTTSETDIKLALDCLGVGRKLSGLWTVGASRPVDPIPKTGIFRSIWCIRGSPRVWKAGQSRCGTGSAAPMVMVIVLLAWFVGSSLSCLALLYVAARQIPSASEMSHPVGHKDASIGQQLEALDLHPSSVPA
jgi:hypothetical protein